MICAIHTGPGFDDIQNCDYSQVKYHKMLWIKCLLLAGWNDFLKNNGPRWKMSLN